nr:DUF2065 domain-containing protein [Rubricella aquisinus]
MALVALIEGAMFALAPGGMKRAMLEIIDLPEETLRQVGLVLAALGAAGFCALALLL